jgi:hypothetical protein
MPTLTLYRDMMERAPGTRRLGLRYIPLALRLTWRPLVVKIDSETEVEVLHSKPLRVSVAPGHHTVEVSGAGIVPVHESIDVGRSTDVVLAISTQTGISGEGNLPRISISAHVVESPRDLATYKFFDTRPTSFGAKSLVFTTLLSMMFSSVLFLCGPILIGVATLEFASQGFGAGLLILACSVPFWTLNPFGLGGVIVGYRFLRLPSDWRRP